MNIGSLFIGPVQLLQTNQHLQRHVPEQSILKWYLFLSSSQMGVGEELVPKINPSWNKAFGSFLGLPVVPFCPFLREGPPTKIDVLKKKWVPTYSNLG